MNINDITITSLETITAFDVVTGAFKFVLDELQNATIAQTEEKSEITGKHGRKLANLKRNKAVTVSGTNGMVSSGLMETQTGGNFENKATEVMWTDYLTVKSNSATTSYKAIGTAGAEIDALYIKNSDGTIGSELEQAATTASGKFAYAPDSKALTFKNHESAERNKELQGELDNLNKLFDDRQKIDDTFAKIDCTFEKINDRIDMLIESDKEGIKSYITEKHHFFVYTQEWIDDYSMECLERRFSVYKQEHGNSFVEGLMNEIRALPKQPPETDEHKYSSTAEYVKSAKSKR